MGKQGIEPYFKILKGLYGGIKSEFIYRKLAPARPHKFYLKTNDLTLGGDTDLNRRLLVNRHFPTELSLPYIKPFL